MADERKKQNWGAAPAPQAEGTSGVNLLDSKVATPLTPEQLWENWIPPTETERLFSDKKVLHIMFQFTAEYAKLTGAAPAETARPTFDGRVEDHKEYEAKLSARTAHYAREVSELLAKVADLEREREQLKRELVKIYGAIPLAVLKEYIPGWPETVSGKEDKAQ